MIWVSDVPAVLSGLIVGFYWARVVKLVRKTRKQTGHGANFVPPEPLGRVLRILWYPTVVVWIAAPLVGGLWHAAPRPLHVVRDYPALHFAGLAVVVAAMGYTLVCWKKMGTSWRMGIDPAEKTKLIFTGPWAYVRHPIYALSSALMLGTLAAAPSWVLLAAAIIHLGFLQWEARREETYLVATHGEPYAAYRRRVGRFIPWSLRPYAPDASTLP